MESEVSLVGIRAGLGTSSCLLHLGCRTQPEKSSLGYTGEIRTQVFSGLLH